MLDEVVVSTISAKNWADYGWADAKLLQFAYGHLKLLMKLSQDVARYRRNHTLPHMLFCSWRMERKMMNKTLKKLKRLNAYSYDVNDLNASDDPG